MMKIVAAMRIAVLLRRIAKALEESNRLAEERMKFECGGYARAKRHPAREMASIGRPTPEMWNERYDREHGT